MNARSGSGRETVLVADDSMTVLAMVSARLERAGYDVVTATRGDEALRLAQELRPRLVVLDVEMPGLDGVEVARQLRADDSLAGMLIILLTAHTEAEEVASGLAAGADDYLTKPFSPQELQARIEQLLGH
jgi:two-component system alkaline phosphatase synthesis response regulator PhoP